MSEKPLGIKAYGSIGHLPGSRRGPGDHGVHEGSARIATLKARDKHDLVIVQEKLDGSNVAVARIDGQIMPLGRAGYRAESSRFLQHRMFAKWVWDNLALFDFLPDNHRLCGEWLAQAHGTRYTLTHAPFVAFDIMTGPQRLSFRDFQSLIADRLPTPHLLHIGAPLSIEAAVKLLGDFGFHGAADPVEGAVWRVERKGKVDFLTKYVRPDKVDGCYLPEISGKEPVWNWTGDGEVRPPVRAEGD